MYVSPYLKVRCSFVYHSQTSNITHISIRRWFLRTSTCKDEVKLVGCHYLMENVIGKTIVWLENRGRPLRFLENAPTVSSRSWRLLTVRTNRRSCWTNRRSCQTNRHSCQSNQAPVEPTDAPVEPMEAPVDPTMAPVEPTDAPVEPTEAPVDPTMAPVEPTDVPIETDAPVSAGCSCYYLLLLLQQHHYSFCCCIDGVVVSWWTSWPKSQKSVHPPQYRQSWVHYGLDLVVVVVGAVCFPWSDSCELSSSSSSCQCWSSKQFESCRIGSRRMRRIEPHSDRRFGMSTNKLC